MGGEGKVKGVGLLREGGIKWNAKQTSFWSDGFSFLRQHAGERARTLFLRAFDDTPRRSTGIEAIPPSKGLRDGVVGWGVQGKASVGPLDGFVIGKGLEII